MLDPFRGRRGLRRTIRDVRSAWPRPVTSLDDGPRISTRRAYVEVLGLYGLFFGWGVATAMLVATHVVPLKAPSLDWFHAAKEAANQVVLAVLAVITVVTLSARRGRHLGNIGFTLRLQQGRRESRQVVTVAGVAALVGLLASLAIPSAFHLAPFPFGARTGPNLLYQCVSDIHAGIAEELVVNAFVVVTLRQAGRRWPEVVGVAVALRALYHVYYGPIGAVVWVIVWGGIFLAVYVLTRAVVALVVVHACFDLFGTLVYFNGAAAALFAMAAVAAVWVGYGLHTRRDPRIPHQRPACWWEGVSVYQRMSRSVTDHDDAHHPTWVRLRRRAGL